MKKTILVVEDEPAISRVLKAYLERSGYQVEQAFDGNEAILKFDQVRPHLVLLDVMLPGRSGWDILQDIRKKGTCPVIMLTALDDIDHKLNGFREGADDYIAKPFINDEVIARVGAILRRPSQVMEEDSFKVFGSLRIDFRAHQVQLYGATIDLNPRDLALVLFLAQNPNQTFTRDQLLDQVWGLDYDGSDRAVDLAVKRVRHTLRNWGINEGEIKTLRGLGYQFCVNKPN